MTDSIDTSEREAEEPAFINLPVREMSDEPAPQQPADALRTALQLALEATPEQLPAALDALRDQLGLTTSSAPCAMAAPSGSRPHGFVKPDNDHQVFFYEQDFYVLSNFSAFSLLWKGLHFPTSEHAYHWEKFPQGAIDLNGDFVRDQIFTARSAHEAFKMAEGWKHLRYADWDARKVEVMRSILHAKVCQHEYVRRKLLATGDRMLIEDSWRDDFWGWGPNRNGQNMLGRLWMAIRSNMRCGQQQNDVGGAG